MMFNTVLKGMGKKSPNLCSTPDSDVAALPFPDPFSYLVTLRNFSGT